MVMIIVFAVITVSGIDAYEEGLSFSHIAGGNSMFLNIDFHDESPLADMLTI
jgi:hypothetical protein